jgi:REP element-mobilizing transposase RayT
MRNRKRNRKKDFDYSSDNLYFVTICVKDMLCCFGEIVEVALDGKRTSLDGERTALELSVRDNLDNQDDIINCIMKLNPYGLIIQERLEWLPIQYPYVIIHNSVVMPNHLHLIVEIDSLNVSKGVKIKSLSSLIGAFKTTASKLIHEAGFLDFAWHRSFHDHIIRNEKSYLNIDNYIDSNPQNWLKDDMFCET